MLSACGDGCSFWIDQCLYLNALNERFMVILF